MSSYRLSRHAIFVSVTALAVTMAEAPQRTVFAQGKLDARYVVTLSGLPIGRGTWVIDIGEDYFTAAASGATAGLLRVFASGEGQSAARGTISGGQLVPSTYASRIVTGDKACTRTFRISSHGASWPVNRRNCMAAWRRNMSTPVMTWQPRFRASRMRSVVSGV